MGDDALTIGQVADQCGVSRDTLRYWEQEEVLPEPPRDESSGYRTYPPKLVRRVRAVDRAQDLGFTLDEIRRLFDGRDEGARCEELAEITAARMEAFREEIERLQKKLDGLKSLSEACPGDLPASDCPVVDLFVEV